MTNTNRSRPRQRIRDTWRDLFTFARDYAGGVGSRDLERLFRRDAADAWRELGGTEEHESGGEVWTFLRRAKNVFLGLSYRLTPARRILFLVAIFLALLGVLDVGLKVVERGLVVHSSPLLLFSSVILLVFLLALELIDRVRVRNELEVARELQQQLLPQQPPTIPGWSFAHSYQTANEIGGDYFDYLPTSDGRLALIVGDASGHGLAAGLLMVIANSTLRLAIDLDPAPHEVARLLNKVLAGTGGSRAFMTLFYGILEPATGRLDYVCAGHPFPLLRRAAGEIEELGQGSLPLGLRSQIELDMGSTIVRPGDLLLLYSDGLPEAVDRDDHAFGFDRLEQLLQPGGSPRQVHDRVASAFSVFLHGESPGDDVSLVVVGRQPETRPG